MIEKSSKRRVSIITEIILFSVFLSVIVSVFNHYYNLKNTDNEIANIVLKENLLVEERNIDEIETENKMYIKDIKNEYGIKVRYGEDIVEFAQNVEAVPQTDVKVINYNLKQIYNALEKYPSAVFDMSRNKKYPITVFILEKFNNKNIALAARTNLNDFRLYITNTAKFERAFHHEMYHLLEYYMEDTKKNLYASWTNLNPTDFKYEKDVSKINDMYVYKELTNELVKQNSLKSEEDLNYASDTSRNPYFVTKYAKATEKEDRAEIFAEIMIATKKPKYMYKEQNIRKKADTLNKAISTNITNEKFFYSKYFE